MGKVTKMFPMIKLTFGALLLLAVTDIGEAKPRNIHIHLYGVQMWNPGTNSYPREGGSDYSDDSEEEDEEADEEKENEEEDTDEDADEDAKKKGSDEKSKESSEEEPKEEEAGDDYSNGRFGTGFAAGGFGNGGMQIPKESGSDYIDYSAGFRPRRNMNGNMNYNSNIKEAGSDYSAMPQMAMTYPGGRSSRRMG